MDKLKPVLAQKFWILTAVALLLITLGWMMGTGDLDATATARIATLDSLKVVPGNTPNDRWSAKLEVLVKDRSEKKLEAQEYLKAQQSKRMKFPQDVRQSLIEYSKKTGIKTIPFEGEFPSVALDEYRYDYQENVEQMHRIVDPFDLKTGKGLCVLDMNTIPHVPFTKWETFPPNSEEIWNTQIDIWLLTSLLECVAKMNEDSRGISESTIRVVEGLALRGGTRKEDGTPDSGRTGKASSDREFMRGGKEFDVATIHFLPEAEFGSDEDRTGQAAAAPVDDDSDENVDASPAPMANMSDKPKKRYVDNDPKLPFKTRGFYISVIMDRTKLQDFLVQLTSLDWPVEIVRVHMVCLNDSGRPEVTTFASSLTDGEKMGVVGGNAGGARGRNPGFLTGGMGPGAQGAGRNMSVDDKAIKIQLAYKAAMRDPNLAQVVVAGLMTMYNVEELTIAEKQSKAKESPNISQSGTVLPDSLTAPEKATSTPTGKNSSATPADNETLQKPTSGPEKPEPTITSPATAKPTSGKQK